MSSRVTAGQYRLALSHSLFRPPLLLKALKTSLALARGAKVQRGIAIPKKPRMRTASRIASTRGSFFPPRNMCIEEYGERRNSNNHAGRVEGLLNIARIVG